MLTPSQFYFKSKIIQPDEMDFKPAVAFDEEDRLKAELAAQYSQRNTQPKLMKRIKYMILG